MLTKGLYKIVLLQTIKYNKMVSFTKNWTRNYEYENETREKTVNKLRKGAEKKMWSTFEFRMKFVHWKNNSQINIKCMQLFLLLLLF